MRKPGTRKAAIVKAAIDCFIEAGVAQTTMSQVAKRAKVDQPLIHYYFPTLEALYLEVFQVALDSLKEASLESIGSGSRGAAAALASYIEGPFRWTRKEPGLFSIWMHFYYLASFKPAFEELNAGIRRTGRERISVLVYGGIESGEFRAPPGMGVRELALVIQGLITGNTILYGTEGERDPAIVRSTVRAALHWLGAKPPK